MTVPPDADSIPGSESSNRATDPDDHAGAEATARDPSSATTSTDETSPAPFASETHTQMSTPCPASSEGPIR